MWHLVGLALGICLTLIARWGRDIPIPFHRNASEVRPVSNLGSSQLPKPASQLILTCRNCFETMALRSAHVRELLHIQDTARGPGLGSWGVVVPA